MSGRHRPHAVSRQTSCQAAISTSPAKAGAVAHAQVDLSVLERPVELSLQGALQVARCLSSGTPELRELLVEECDVIFECRSCRNLFRSLANFIAHKRHYCAEKSSAGRDRSASLPAVRHPEHETLVIQPEPPREVKRKADPNRCSQYIKEEEEEVSEHLQAETAASEPHAGDHRRGKDSRPSKGKTKEAIVTERDPGGGGAAAPEVGARVNGDDDDAPRTAGGSSEAVYVEGTSPAYQFYTGVAERVQARCQARKRSLVELEDVKGNSNAKRQTVVMEASAADVRTAAMRRRRGPTHADLAIISESFDRIEPRRAGHGDGDDGGQNGGGDGDQGQQAGGRRINLRRRSCGGEVTTPIAEKLRQRDDCDVKTLTCCTCKAQYSSLKTLHFHMMSLHSEKRTFYPCVYCAATFSQLWAATRHLTKTHGCAKAQVDKLKPTLKRYAFSRAVDDLDDPASSDAQRRPPALHASSDLTVVRATRRSQAEAHREKTERLRQQATETISSVTKRLTEKRRRKDRDTTVDFGSSGFALHKCLNCSKAFAKKDSLSRHQAFCFGLGAKEAEDDDDRHHQGAATPPARAATTTTRSGRRPPGKTNKDGGKSTGTSVDPGKMEPKSRARQPRVTLDDIAPRLKGEALKAAGELLDAANAKLDLRKHSDTSISVTKGEPNINTTESEANAGGGEGRSCPDSDTKASSVEGETTESRTGSAEVAPTKAAAATAAAGEEETSSPHTLPTLPLLEPKVEKDDQAESAPLDVSSTDESAAEGDVSGSPLHPSRWTTELDARELERVRTLIDEARLVCLKCDRRYGSLSNLHRHAVRHLGLRRFRCTLCTFTGYNRSECKTHLRRVHLEKPTSSSSGAGAAGGGWNKFILDLEPEKMKTGVLGRSRVESQRPSSLRVLERMQQARRERGGGGGGGADGGGGGGSSGAGGSGAGRAVPFNMATRKATSFPRLQNAASGAVLFTRSGHYPKPAQLARRPPSSDDDEQEEQQQEEEQEQGEEQNNIHQSQESEGQSSTQEGGGGSTQEEEEEGGGGAEEETTRQVEEATVAPPASVTSKEDEIGGLVGVNDTSSLDGVVSNKESRYITINLGESLSERNVSLETSPYLPTDGESALTAAAPPPPPDGTVCCMEEEGQEEEVAAMEYPSLQGTEVIVLVVNDDQGNPDDPSAITLSTTTTTTTTAVTDPPPGATPPVEEAPEEEQEEEVLATTDGEVVYSGEQLLISSGEEQHVYITPDDDGDITPEDQVAMVVEGSPVCHQTVPLPDSTHHPLDDDEEEESPMMEFVGESELLSVAPVAQEELVASSTTLIDTQ